MGTTWFTPIAARPSAFDLGTRYHWSDDFVPQREDNVGIDRFLNKEQILYGVERQLPLGDPQLNSYLVARLLTPRSVALQRTFDAALFDLGLLASLGGMAFLLFGLYAKANRERIRAEEQRSHLAALIDSSYDAIVSVDPHGVVQAWNPAAEKLFGYGHEEAIGQPLSAVLDEVRLDPANQQTLSPSRDSTADTPVALCCEATFRHREGDLRHVSLTRANVGAAQLSSLGTVLVLRDIGHDRTLRDRLIELNSHLEHEVAERTAKLERAREEAEAANAAKGQFLAKMSHEIRTPMGAMLGALQLLQRLDMSRAQERYMQVAEKAARVLLGTINDILDYSKIQAGKLSLAKETFALEDLLREVGAMSSVYAEAKNIDVVFDIDYNTPQLVMSDPLRLKQVLLNLLGNAIKFTEHGYVRLTVRRAADTERPSLEFSVLDTGIGMTPEQVSRVFAGFEQAEASTTRRYGGTGLGLSITRHLLELMGSHLKVESDLLHGSDFSFTLAIGEVGAVTTAESAIRLDGLDILIIDEAEVSRAVLASAVSSRGGKVRLVSSEQEAITALSVAEASSAHLSSIAILNLHYHDERSPALLASLLAQTNAGCGRQAVLMATAHTQATLLAEHPHLEDRVYIVTQPATAAQLAEAIASCVEAEDRALHSRIRPTSTRRLRDVKLLIVDDNQMNREVALELLAAEGASVTTVGDAAVALRTLRASPFNFDAVLMDVHMAGIDGLAATRIMREELGLEQLPVIAVTADTTDECREACVRGGIQDYIGKPFDVDQMVRCIRQALQSTAESNKPAGPPAMGSSWIRTNERSAFDFDKALQRVGRKHGVLARVIRAFCEQYHDWGETWSYRVVEPLTEEMRRQLLREVHNLKGQAKMVGAELVGRRCEELEAKASTNYVSHQLVSRLALLASALSEALVALDREATRCEVQPSLAPAPTATDLDADRLQALMLALQDRDMQAVELYNELRPALTAVAPDTAERLDAFIRELDFNSARAVCEALDYRLSA